MRSSSGASSYRFDGCSWQAVSLSLPPEKVGGTPIQLTHTLGNVLRFSLQTDDNQLRELH